MREGCDRPGWDHYFLRLAEEVASRATCPRRQVGAVLVRDQRVIATGYNGSPRGGQHCHDAGCLMEDGHCIRCVHAELNALLQCAAGTQSSAGAILYCTHLPCVHCAKALVQADVRAVIYVNDYPDAHTRDVFRAGEVTLLHAVASPTGYSVTPEA